MRRDKQGWALAGWAPAGFHTLSEEDGWDTVLVQTAAIKILEDLSDCTQNGWLRAGTVKAAQNHASEISVEVWSHRFVYLCISYVPSSHHGGLNSYKPYLDQIWSN